MNLFSDEVINISKIHTIAMFDSVAEIPNGIRHYSSCLPTYELIYHISGEGITHFNGVKIHDCEDSLRYLPKGAENSEYTVKKISDGICIDIYFDTPDPMPLSALSLKNIPELKNLFTKIYNIWSSKKSGYYIDCMAVFFEIIKTIQKHNKKYISCQQSKKINCAYEYMVENFKDKNFDYKELCKTTGLSYSYFKELFVSKYGMPPVKYLTYLRIEYAKELLITGRHSIEETAEMCGYENVYYFSTVFKKHVGVSPSKYKYIQTNNNQV